MHTMSLLTVTLTTPLLKAPILVGNAVCIYYGLTPPSVPPIEAKERKSIGTAKDFSSGSKKIMKAGVAISKVSVDACLPCLLRLVF